MADRSQLEAWIAKSHVTQHRLKLVLLIASVGAFAVTFVSHAFGALIFVSIAIVAIFGFWITSGHIADWQKQIEAGKSGARPPRSTAGGRLRRERD